MTRMPATRTAREGGFVQPLRPSSMSPYVTPASPPLARSMPSGSIAGRSAARDSGTSTTTAMRPRIATGTFIKKIHPHHRLVKSQPPKMGPIGRARKLAAAQMPIARGRCSSENSTVTTDSAMTTIAAPAAPRSTRPAMNWPGLVEYAHAIEPAPNTASAPRRIRLRPKRSPRTPAGSIPAARTRAYADENHWRSDSDAFSAPARVGSATLSTVTSRPTARTARSRAASAHHFRAPIEFNLPPPIILKSNVFRVPIRLSKLFQNALMAAAKEAYAERRGAHRPLLVRHHPHRRPDVRGRRRDRPRRGSSAEEEALEGLSRRVRPHAPVGGREDPLAVHPARHR